MEIKVRGAARSKHREVIVTHDAIRIDMGMMDRKERLALARTLEEAIDDLTDDLGEDTEEA